MTNLLVATIGLFFFSLVALTGLWLLQISTFSGQHFLGVVLILFTYAMLAGGREDAEEDRVYFISQEGLQVREVLYDPETGEFTVEVMEEENE